MKVSNTVCKKCDGWGEIEKENKLLPCNNCDGDYFYNGSIRNLKVDQS